MTGTEKENQENANSADESDVETGASTEAGGETTGGEAAGEKVSKLHVDIKADDPIEDIKKAFGERVAKKIDEQNDLGESSGGLGEDIGAAIKSYDDLLEENEAVKDRLLRTMADSENLRRRAKREKEDAAKYAISAFARDLLEVSDNLTRALDAVPDEELAAGGEQLGHLYEGVQLTGRVLQAAFDRHKIQLIEPQGERFDPNFHQAVAEIPGTDHPNGTVVDVMQTGYLIGDRLLRPAMVTVAKGDAKK